PHLASHRASHPSPDSPPCSTVHRFFVAEFSFFDSRLLALTEHLACPSTGGADPCVSSQSCQPRSRFGDTADSAHQSDTASPLPAPGNCCLLRRWAMAPWLSSFAQAQARCCSSYRRGCQTR